MNRAFGINWVLPRRVDDLLFGWRIWFGKHSSDIWNFVPLCLIWLLWKERNRCMFEDTKRSKAQLIQTLFDWSRLWGLTNSNSLLHFTE